ncbi:hypothetical protein ACWDA7_38105, partial [Streptomyces sp. NPDC001156]
MAWDTQVLRGSNKAITPKYTELMAVAVALTTQRRLDHPRRWRGGNWPRRRSGSRLIGERSEA